MTFAHIEKKIAVNWAPMVWVRSIHPRILEKKSFSITDQVWVQLFNIGYGSMKEYRFGTVQGARGFGFGS